MDFLQKERFFPNECAVCESRNKIRKCSGCKMVSYCGRDHQLNNWPIHKSFCKAISKILEEKQLSYLFENLSREDLSTWIEEKEKVSELVKRKLGRSLTAKEAAILKFPRVCFVCRKAKQEKLKDCSGCSAASFCDIHPSSEIHDRNCSVMRNRFEFFTKKLISNPVDWKCFWKSISSGTKVLSSDDPPKSMKDFFDNYIVSKTSIPEIKKIMTSEIWTLSLSIFNALQKLYDTFPPEIVVHLDANQVFNSESWECLLHLLPGVKSLKIVHIEGNVTSASQISLCKDCKSKKRTLFIEANSISYERYMTERSYQTPNIIAYLNKQLPNYKDLNTRLKWINTIKRWSKVTCPMVFTIAAEESFKMMEKDLLHSEVNFRIIYTGFNDFASMMVMEEKEDGAVCRSSQFMILFKHEELAANDTKSTVNRPRSCFYPSICHVCRKINLKLTCNRCRIVSYCTDTHRDQDQIHHKDICKAILSLLSEMGTPNLFDKRETTDPESWLKARIDLMKKVAVKLDRKLEEYEKEMFLFPKVCAVCHDSDLSVLRSCKCGACLCKIHNDDSTHKQVCKELYINFKVCVSEQLPILMHKVVYPVIKSHAIVPSSMQDYVASYCSSSEKTSDESINYQALATSNFLTSAFTLHYALKKLKKEIHSSMVIHIIGARNSDLRTEPAWIYFLYSLERLENLKIIFIGKDITNCPETIIDTSKHSEIAEKMFKVECYAMKYEQYFSSNSFIKPNIILGCNLNIHESELGISENTWKEDISVLAGMQKVSFILTAGTKERAEKDHKIICSYFERSVNYTFLEKSPFASMSPERDFETGGVFYPNRYIIAYDDEFKKAEKKNCLS